MAAAGVEAFDPAAPSPSHAPGPRHDVKAAIAKAFELRQLHAALIQRGTPNARAGASAGRSPAVIRFPPAASPARSRTAADEEYPVFTPAYGEEERVPGLSHICQDNRSRSENWSGVALDRGGGDDDAALSDYDNVHAAFSSSNSEVLFPSSNDHRLRNRGAAYKIHPAFLHSAPSADRFLPSAGRAAYTSELKLPPATCSNTFRPATISSSRVAPPSEHSRTKNRGPQQILSWFFPKSRKKAKPPETTPAPASIERENMSRLLTEWGALSSLDSLRRELAEANAHRDAALQEAAEVRSSLGELATKMLSLEEYCSELKKALRQATSSPSVSRRSTRSADASRELPMPVSHDVMVEGFLQIASEARLSVKQLCKALIQQAEEDADDGLSDKLNLLLRPYQLALAGDGKQCSKAVLYHLEAIVNRAMYQDFENRAFQRDGSPRCLDPAQDRRESFAAFAALRNLSWNEVVRKGTRHYSEEFSRFCDRKMNCVVGTLGWSRPWPEQLLQGFFVAAKCVWLLHLLAFSFGPPLTILRIEDGRAFDQMFMEDILMDRQRAHSPCQVKIMVMPGFYVHDSVLKCRVLTSRSVV